MAVVRCDDRCKWPEHSNAERRLLCRGKRDCSCGVCGSLQSIDLNLYEGCLAMCNVTDARKRPQNIDDFWKTLDPADVWRRYKVQVNGFDPNTTIEAELNKEKQERIDKQATNQNELTKNLLMGVGIIVLLFLITKILRG